jgi:disulfide bond formation protein DsbB
MSKLKQLITPFTEYGLYAAFTLALLSMLISLYFSDVMHLVPCLLCWWGRIFMYPLVAIFSVGILRRDHNAVFYAAPLVLLGILLSGYHTLLQWKIIPESYAPCTTGVPCGNVSWQVFGFITIPFLECLSFIAIGICIYAYYVTRPKA